VGRLATAAALGCIGMASAQASPITIVNTTALEAYQGNSPTNYFNGQPWGTVVGPEFTTTQVTVDKQSSAIDFKFATQFNGTAVVSGQTVRYADIFINTNGTANPPASYNYAIALGAQAGNGGLSTPGLYQVTSVKTSQDIWSGRSGFVYAGQYAPQSDLSLARTPPSVVTAGTKMVGWTVTETYSNGVLDVLLTANDPALLSLFNNFDLFWGTADCANGGLFTDIVTAAAVREPGTFAIFAAALLGMCFLLRRRADPDIDGAALA
jgi:hypothetical protein